MWFSARPSIRHASGIGWPTTTSSSDTRSDGTRTAAASSLSSSSNPAAFINVPILPDSSGILTSRRITRIWPDHGALCSKCAHIHVPLEVSQRRTPALPVTSPKARLALKFRLIPFIQDVEDSAESRPTRRTRSSSWVWLSQRLTGKLGQPH